MDKDNNSKNENIYVKYLKHNYIVNIGDGAIFSFALGMVPLATVLIYFISGFVDKKVLIGLLSFLWAFLSLTPQLFISKKLESLKKYKPFMLITSAIQRTLWLLLGLDVIFFAKNNPLLFVILFYIIFACIGFMTAVTGLSWLNMMAKIIPNQYRAKFFGIRFSISSLFESGGALVMGLILSRLEYPYNYGFLFIIVFLISMSSLFFLRAIKEEPEEKEIPESKGFDHIARIKRMFKNDKNYLNYFWTVLLMVSFGKIIFVFQIVYAKEKIGITVSQVATATFIMLVCQTIGYSLWGLAANKIGLKRIFVLTNLIFYPAIILTFLMTSPVMLYIAIGLERFAQSGRIINENNLMINLCRNEKDRPLYIGARNGILGPLIAFNPIIAGLIYDTLGYGVLFVISIIGTMAGLYIMVKKVKIYDE